jgi:hypothetical protein
MCDRPHQLSTTEGYGDGSGLLYVRVFHQTQPCISALPVAIVVVEGDDTYVSHLIVSSHGMGRSERTARTALA